jgi:hypothetical protein
MSFCLRFLKRKQVSSPILLRSLVNASIWIFAGFLAAFGRLYSLPLELQAEIATPILVVASAMFLTFIFSVVRRKSKLQRDIESCDEFIDFVIDEASSTVMNVGGISVAICVMAYLETKAFNLDFIGISALCYVAAWTMSKRLAGRCDINNGTNNGDQK